MKKDKYFIAFDLALINTGYAIFRVTSKNDGQVFDVVEVASIGTKKIKERSAKLDHIARKVIELREKFDPFDIAIEDGFVRYREPTRALFEVRGVVSYVLHGIPQFFYAPNTIKKEVSPKKGKKTKDDVREAVQEIYPKLKMENNDESDAVAIGLCHIKKMEWK